MHETSQRTNDYRDDYSLYFPRFKNLDENTKKKLFFFKLMTQWSFRVKIITE